MKPIANERTKELIARGATAGKYDPFGAYPGPDRQLSTAVLNEVREMIAGIRDGGLNFDICARIPTLVSILLTIGWPRTPLFMRVGKHSRR